MVLLVVALASGGGVATALFVVPRASEAVQAISTATVYAEPDEEQPAEVAGPAEPEAVGEEQLGDEPEEEPEIPVGEEETPEPEDPAQRS